MENPAKFCVKCGAPLKEGKAFCVKCGAPVQVSPAGKDQPHAAQEQAPSEPAYAAPEPNASGPAHTVPQPGSARPGASVFKKAGAIIKAPPSQLTKVPKADAVITLVPARGKKSLLLVGLAALAIAAAAIGIIRLTMAGSAALPMVTYTYQNEERVPEVTYEAVDTIYPSLYNTMDSIVNFTATCEQGERDVLVQAEIPGFTQPYEQKFTLSQQITKFYIKPPVLAGDLNLNSQKTAQLKFSITDLETGKIIVQDSKNIQMMSAYDFILWEDDFGYSNWDNFLAWLTPEDPQVQQLKRYAIEWISQMTGGQFSMMPGYQDTGLFGDQIQMNTLYQALAVQGGMSAMGVRYNMGSFSMSNSTAQLQRVQLPAETLKSLSGVCIETSLVVASALQSAGMNVMLVFPPGHAQVAVECWPNTGEYFLIETTILPVNERNMNGIVTYMTKEQWMQYILNPWGNGSGGCYVLDCSLATPMGILPLPN